MYSQIAGSSSWHARYSVLTYLQIMVFYNLFTMLSNEQAVQSVQALVIRLLEDEQLEVYPYSVPLVPVNTSKLHLLIPFSFPPRWERWQPLHWVVSCSVISWPWTSPCRLILRLYAKPDCLRRGRGTWVLLWTPYPQLVRHSLFWYYCNYSHV